MKLALSKFCALSTSDSWHQWLYKYDKDIYQDFIALMKNSKNCNDNKKIMQQILAQILKRDDSFLLYDFLCIYHPLTISNKKTNDNAIETNTIFPNYDPNIMTYPRRIILYNQSTNLLKKRLKSFLADKMVNDYIIIDNKAYVEYLENEDIDLLDSIPAKNWLIAAFRKNNPEKCVNMV